MRQDAAHVALPIDVVVPTLNEELAIRRCLEPLLENFRTVHVVDSESTDQTCQVATSMGARVETFRWGGHYPKKKQWSLDNLPFTSDWVLFVDADEVVGPELIDELRAVDLSRFAAFDLKLEYYWRGHQLRYGQQVSKRALIDRHRVAFPVIDDSEAPGMGEQEGHYQPNVRGRIGQLSGRLGHNDPDSISSWFVRHNRYSDWEAFLRVNPLARQQVRAARSFQGRVLDRLPVKGAAIFVYNFVLKSGWRDGVYGLEYAPALAYYHFQIGVKERELRERKNAAAGGSRNWS